mgnify:CR=1 FL=1
MSRLIPHRDMTADDVLQCCVQARALINMCERAVWADIINGTIEEGKTAEVHKAADDIQCALSLAAELLDPVQDTLEASTYRKGGGK